MPESLRRQESGLILLNLAVMAGIAVAHALFAPALGAPSRLFFLVLFGRMALQVAELAWLQEDRTERALAAYSRFAIGLNLLFAFLLSQLGGLEDSHYVVLMIVPVLAAAFRYRPAGIALVLGAATGLTFLQLWLYFRAHGPVKATEYFEAANVVLIYVVVALVVSLLGRQVRSDQAALEASLRELRETRDLLVREEKLAAVGRLASGIAHEIRNPVAMILSSIAMGRGGGGLPREELDGIVEQEARRLERLTSDFLLYARQKPPERRPAELAAVLEYVAGLARARAAEAGVSLEVSCPEGLAADLDPFQIHQALLNLLLNALDATPAGGTVRLGAGPGEEEVRIFVEDSGGPIPPAAAERIFEPFFTTKPAGTGLGLAIGRSLARAHGGDIALAANEPGRVRFELTLPEGPALSLPEPREAAWRAS